jgi:hypothetical protein
VEVNGKARLKPGRLTDVDVAGTETAATCKVTFKNYFWPWTTTSYNCSRS